VITHFCLLFNVPLGTSCIRGDNTAISPILNIFFDPFDDCWLSVQIIYWNIKETLGKKEEIVKEIIILFW